MFAPFRDRSHLGRDGQASRHDVVLPLPPDLTRPPRPLPPGFPMVRFLGGIVMVIASTGLMFVLGGAFVTSWHGSIRDHGAPGSRSAPACRSDASADRCWATSDAYVVDTDNQSGGIGTFGVATYGMELLSRDFNDQWVYVDSPAAAFIAAAAPHDVVSVAYLGCAQAHGDRGCGMRIDSVTAGSITLNADPVVTQGRASLDPTENPADVYTPADRPGLLIAVAILGLIAWSLLCSAGMSRASLLLGVDRGNWPWLIRLIRRAAYITSFALVVGGTVLLGCNVVAAGLPLILLAYGIVIYAVAAPVLVPLGPRRAPSRLVA